MDVVVKIRTASEKDVEEGEYGRDDVDGHSDINGPELPLLDHDACKEDAQRDLECHDRYEISGLADDGPLAKSQCSEIVS